MVHKKALPLAEIQAYQRRAAELLEIHERAVKAQEHGEPSQNYERAVKVQEHGEPSQNHERVVKSQEHGEPFQKKCLNCNLS